jgi:hypothetical protein
MGDKNHKIFFNIKSYLYLKYNVQIRTEDNFIRLNESLVCTSYDLIVRDRDKDDVLTILSLYEGITTLRVINDNDYFSNGYIIIVRIYYRLVPIPEKELQLPF